MIRHLVVFTFRPGTTAEQVDELARRLRELPGLIPTIRRYELGTDLRLRDGNADFAVVAEFDDVDGFLTYSEHPAHQAVIAECIRPIVASRLAVQLAV